MTDLDTYEKILSSLHDAMLDTTHWPAASKVIDEACGLEGNGLLVAEGPVTDITLGFVGLIYRGQRRHDLEREYLRDYHSIDERVPRMRNGLANRLVHVSEQYTPEELKTSRTYNELLIRGRYGDSFAVRVPGLDGSYLTWGIADPVSGNGWSSSQIEMLKRLVPRVRNFVVVRQALLRAGVRASNWAGLLESSGIGIIHLDRRGAVLEANDRATGILKDRRLLTDEDGALRATRPKDTRRLERLLAAALPASGDVAVGGSMPLRRAAPLPPLVVHVKPADGPLADYGVLLTAALVLIFEAGVHPRINPDLVAAALGLTPAESRVALGLAAGQTVEGIALAMGHTRHAVYWHLKRIYRKLSISRQAELVRLVLSVGYFG